jgi:protein SCO1/2
MLPQMLERFGVRLHQTSVPVAGAPRFPNVLLTSHRREVLRFYDDLLRGKLVVIGFMYTRCQGICPATILSMQKLQTALGTRLGGDIFFYSITLDPLVDTAAVLDLYATTIGAGLGWSFLTGSPEDIERLRRRLGFVDPDPVVDADKSQHAGLLLAGSEPDDRWVAFPAPLKTQRVLRLLSRVSNSWET